MKSRLIQSEPSQVRAIPEWASKDELRPQAIDGAVRLASSSSSSDLVAALGGFDAGRERALANRTQRAVHNAAEDLRERRHLGRRSTAIALLTLAGLLMLLSPAIWNSVDDLLGGEFLLDLPGMVAAMAFTLFAAIAAVLFLLSSQSKGDLRHQRR